MEIAELRDRLARLCREAFGDGARVDELTALAGDASSRRYFRLGIGGPGPSTAVAMLQPDSGLAMSSEELAVFDEPPREMPFLEVQRYLRAAGVAVPEVYASDTGHGLVLIEDLGDLTLWDAARAAGAGAVGLYRAAIDGIVRLQSAGRSRPDPRCIAFRQRFDERLFLWELDHFLEFGFLGRTLAAADRAEIRKRLAPLADELGAEPASLAHRDYHSWNLFVQPPAVIRVIDFQDALLAPAAYDLASLLTDRATPRVVTAPLESELLEHFRRRRQEETGEELRPAALAALYHRLVLQRALKVVGRFNYLEEVKGKRGYRAMLPDTLATVRRSLGQLSELAPLRTLLARSFPELA